MSRAFAGAPLVVPDDLLTQDLGTGWTRWRQRLPRLADDVVREWELRPDGDLRSGLTALAVPVRTPDGRAAVLKLGWPHWEAEHEHLALRAWGGRGAVQLLRADPTRCVLLLERAADRDLAALPAVEACEIVGQLYGALHRPALPQLRRLSVLAQEWAERLGQTQGHRLVPRRLVTQAIAHLEDLAVSPTTDGTLLHTDLHYDNVLASLRGQDGPDVGGWLAIDPKPLSGDPAYEVAPLLWNRLAELGGHDVRAEILDRFFAAIDAAGLDEDRSRAWVMVRGMVNVLWAVEEADRSTPVDPAYVTQQTTVVKAMIP